MASYNEALLEVQDVWKSFGKKIVLQGLSFRIRRGEIYALIGPNGAGKTTTLRVIMGIYKPDKGVIKVCGETSSSKARECLAYLPETTSVYNRLTGLEHLKLIIGLYTGSEEATKKLIKKAIEYSGLGSDISRRVGEYSKGMKRRLFLAAILSLNPPILVLDEPTSGLDVHSAVGVRELIRRAAEEGRAVLLTSHNMLEVERLASRVGFLHNGKIIAEGEPSMLIEKYGARDLEEAFVKATRSVVRDDVGNV